MSVILRQDPLQTLSYALFELTGEKLFELFHFVTRNSTISRVIRQVRIVCTLITSLDTRSIVIQALFRREFADPALLLFSCLF